LGEYFASTLSPNISPPVGEPFIGRQHDARFFISTVQQPEEQTVFLREALFRCLPELAKQHGMATGITHRFDFRQDNFAVPDVLSQTHVDIVHFGHFVACFSGWRFWVFQVTSDRSFRATNLSRNINNIRTLLAHLLYHVKVLSAQHADVLSGVRTSRKQHVGWSGQSKW